VTDESRAGADVNRFKAPGANPAFHRIPRNMQAQGYLLDREPP